MGAQARPCRLTPPHLDTTDTCLGGSTGGVDSTSPLEGRWNSALPAAMSRMHVNVATSPEYDTDWGDEALEKCKNWLVTEPMVYIMPKADPKQTAKDKLAARGAGDICEGDGVYVDGNMWLKMSMEGKDAWILIDGKAVNVKRKFLEPVPG